jgi:hypothetical protein
MNLPRAGGKASPHLRTGLIAFEPSLRLGNTDIENCRAETRAQTSPGAAQNVKICTSETARRGANGRKFGVFSHMPHMSHGDGTGWLGREDSNLRMAESKSS